MKKLQIFAIKQNHPNNCWAACLSMAVNYLKDKDKFSEKELDDKFKGEEKGLQLFDVNNLWSDAKLGLNCEYFQSQEMQEALPAGEVLDITFDFIKKNIDLERPIILGVNGHALIIIGYEQNEKIILCNPWTGKEETWDFKKLKKEFLEILIIKK